MDLDCSRLVVLALHYQNEVLHPDGRMRFGAAKNAALRDQVVQNGAALLATARTRGWPIVHVRIAYRPDYSDVVQNCEIFRTVVAQQLMAEGSWGAEFLQELVPMRSSTEHVVTHHRVNAFYGSSLATLLESLRPTALAIAGVATNSVVEHTARHACDMGYPVLVLHDACAAASIELHEAALRNLKMCGDVMTVAELQAMAASSGNSDRGVV